MPTRRERHYYELGYMDGRDREPMMEFNGSKGEIKIKKRSSPKRKMSAWNKYVKNKRNHITYRDGKLNLKKMGVAFRRKQRR